MNAFSRYRNYRSFNFLRSNIHCFIEYETQSILNRIHVLYIIPSSFFLHKYDMFLWYIFSWFPLEKYGLFLSTKRLAKLVYTTTKIIECLFFCPFQHMTMLHDRFSIFLNELAFLKLSVKIALRLDIYNKRNDKMYCLTCVYMSKGNS